MILRYLVEKGGVRGGIADRVGLDTRPKPRGLLLLLQIGYGSENKNPL